MQILKDLFKMLNSGHATLEKTYKQYGTLNFPKPLFASIKKSLLMFFFVFFQIWSVAMSVALGMKIDVMLPDLTVDLIKFPHFFVAK